MAERKARIERKTKETDITLSLNLDRPSAARIRTGVGFFDHMLTSLAKHSGLGLQVRCKGDLHVDAHHTVEDVGIALGQALRQALGDRRGISRYGDSLLPMDEALAMVAIDFSNRGLFAGDLTLAGRQLGGFDTELVGEFLRAFALHAGATLHVRLLCGDNLHHQIEAIFKGLGRTLRQAIAFDNRRPTQVPSTKGVL